MLLWQTASSSCQVFRPVRMLARHGLHLGFDVNARLNRMPSLATRSKFGVFANLHPYALGVFQFMSSKMMNRMFGRGAESTADDRPAATARTARAIERKRVIVV